MGEHQFTFSFLKPGSGSNKQPYYKMLMFIKKRPDISDEQFHEHWRTVHADLSCSAPDWGVHVVRYVQLHQTSADKEALKKLGMDVLDFDGMGELHVKSLDDWVQFSSSPVFAEKLGRKSI